MTLQSTTTGLTYSDDFLLHDTGPGHPERPARLEAIVAGLKSAGLWDRLLHLPFEACGIEDAGLVHDRDYLLSAKRTCEQRLHDRLDGDTVVCRESFRLALLASGACMTAADAVLDGVVSNAFCIHRPPGHHAEFDHAMGFCLINHVAVAAEHLIKRRGLSRVAIIDFDVHHGNGTQHTFETRSDVLFVSLHQDPTRFYPGTGFAHEQGKGPGLGYTLNVPMRPGSGDAEYQAAMLDKVLPRIDAFKPEFVLASAGFDAADGDPLASMRLSASGFAMLTRQLKSAAQRHCAGRLVSVLEGGYSLENLKSCASAHVAALLWEDWTSSGEP